MNSKTLAIIIVLVGAVIAILVFGKNLGINLPGSLNVGQEQGAPAAEIVSESDELGDIQKELDETNFDDIEQELQDTSKDLDSL